MKHWFYQQRLFIFLSLGLITSGLNAANLTVHTEPTVVTPGEPFTLILELDENAPAGLPDFGPLGYDFYIHGTSHSASYVYQNGQAKTSTRWRVTLLPKNSSARNIPAIQVGQARTKPFTLNQNQATRHTQPSADTAPPNETALIIKTKLSDTKPFVNQQTLYTVKIFHLSSVLDAAYQPPNLGDALIIPVGTSQQYQAIEGGRPYVVEEQKYAFFPQKTGHQVLFPPKFQALIYDDIPRRAEAQGKTASLAVQAIPSPFTANDWLPAKSLSLHETYDQSQTELTEGATITRTIMLKAVGLPAELLPAIEPEQGLAFKVYPEKPKKTTNTEGNNVTGTLTLKLTYLFNQPGEMHIPEQKISWFNTNTQQIETQTLPQKTFTIRPDANTVARPPNTNTKAPVETPNVTADVPVAASPRAFMPSLVTQLTLFASLLIMSFSLFLYRKNKAHQKPLKTLKKACHANDPLAARHALLGWAKHTWPNQAILNLDDVIRHAANTSLAEALQDLSKSLYHPEKNVTWDGRTLLHAVMRRPRKRQGKQKNTHTLPPMYPN